MANRFYTILVVPEKTSRIRKIVLPIWLVRCLGIGIAAVVLFASVMFLDYWYVMSQIGENRQLKQENRRLQQQIQVYQNKIATAESTLDRVKSFATRLRVMMNLEDQVTPFLQGNLPEANLGHRQRNLPAPNLAIPAQLSQPPSPVSPQTKLNPAQSKTETKLEDLKKESDPPTETAHTDTTQLDLLIQEANRTEAVLQDQYESLRDKKAFLAALPTRQPAPGYFTSGFGIRTSPYGDRIKMHEGLDIANRPGTEVRAPADGEVVYANSKPGYGLTVVLNHGYGIETWYGHLKDFTVKAGEKVKRGARIALMGNTGWSTGPHVHYEVRVRGYPVDPQTYIFENPAP